MAHQRVLAPRGYDGPVYNKGGDSRLNITASVMVSADAKFVGIRLVYKGERGRQKQLQDLPKDGVAGQWQCSVSKSGYVTRDPEGLGPTPDREGDQEAGHPLH